MVLDGLWPQAVSSGASFQVTAKLPDGAIERLLWVYRYRARFRISVGRAAETAARNCEPGRSQWLSSAIVEGTSGGQFYNDRSSTLSRAEGRAALMLGKQIRRLNFNHIARWRISPLTLMN